MERLWSVIQVVLPVISALVLGWAVRRKCIMTERGMSEMKNLLVNICLPAVLFSTFCNMRFSWREAVLFFTMAGVTLIAFLLGFAARRILGMEQPVSPWLCTTIEGGSIGYALFILLFGQENLYHLALLDAGNALVQWSLVMSLLAAKMGGQKSRKETLRSLVTPINTAIVLGLLFSVTGWGARLAAGGGGKALLSALEFIGTPVSALIMMSVGFGMTFAHVDWKETGKAVAARACIFAVLGCAVSTLAGRIFADDMLYRNAALVFFILPPTFAYSVYVRSKEDSAFLSGYLAVYTLLTVAAFTVLAAFLR